MHLITSCPCSIFLFVLLSSSLSSLWALPAIYTPLCLSVLPSLSSFLHHFQGTGLTVAAAVDYESPEKFPEVHSTSTHHCCTTLSLSQKSGNSYKLLQKLQVKLGDVQTWLTSFSAAPTLWPWKSSRSLKFHFPGVPGSCREEGWMLPLKFLKLEILNRVQAKISPDGWRNPQTHRSPSQGGFEWGFLVLSLRSWAHCLSAPCRNVREQKPAVTHLHMQKSGRAVCDSAQRGNAGGIHLTGKLQVGHWGWSIPERARYPRSLRSSCPLFLLLLMYPSLAFPVFLFFNLWPSLLCSHPLLYTEFRDKW